MVIRLGIVPVFCIGCLLLFACNSRERVVDAGAREQVLHIASGPEPQSLDPHLVTGSVEMRILQNLFEGLVDMDPVTLQPVPAAAERWEISESGRRYTFYLRHNLKWSNGDPVTAGDFHYGIHRVLSPGLGNSYVDYFFQGITNALQFNKGEVTDFNEVGFKVVDDHTFEILLDAPNPVLLHYLNQPSFYPVHKATIEAYGRMDERGTGWFRPGKLVGNGAFVLKEWITNTVVSLEPNPYYWDRDTVRLNQVHFYSIENSDTQYRAYQNGQVHVALQIPLHLIMAMEKTRPPDYRSHLLFGIYFYVFNVEKPPLDDPRVRKALSMAINRKDIVEQVTQGGQQPAFSYIPPDANRSKPVAKITEDYDEARRLLAEAGYPGGRGFPVLEVLYNTAESHLKIAEAIQQMWKTVLGIDIRMVNMEWKVFLDVRNAGDFQIARSGWGSDTDYAGYLNLFLSDSGNNVSNWSNPRFDSLYIKAATLMDPELRMKTIQEAESILLEEMPMIPINFYTRNYLVDTRLKNWHSSPTDMRQLKYMYFHE